MPDGWRRSDSLLVWKLRRRGRTRIVRCNWPYRDAVWQNQAAVCTLHRGVTSGLLDRLDPGARLARFVPKDPYDAGCLVELTGVRS